MKKMNRFMGIALALVMALSLCVPAFAADVTMSGNTSGEIPVKVTTEADITFKVTMPTAFSIAVDKDGTVTTANNLQITNLSAGAVKVAGMAIAGANSWEIKDYDDNFLSYAVNSKVYGMSILGQDTNASGGIDTDLTKFVNDNNDNYMWAGMGNAQAVAHNTIALPYTARVAAQNTALADAVIGNVVFTVAWYEV